eukprot:Pompholyxophrys_punicea_v1_NODE_108_length_3447_cov_25.761498.p2 type:complete len:105 gc:universal NODE_108_length_3447_cov_25.761498:2272-2586(+)
MELSDWAKVKKKLQEFRVNLIFRTSDRRFVSTFSQHRKRLSGVRKYENLPDGKDASTISRWVKDYHENGLTLPLPSAKARKCTDEHKEWVLAEIHQATELFTRN